MDDLFAALASPHRRLLLDRLNERDGRTLGELEAELPVTRFAVMKHLRVLEDAHLVVTRKVGREKLHYLNRAPLQEMSDRWISRYAAPFARTMSDLKAALEHPTPMSEAMSEAKSEPLSEAAPRHVYELFIRATAEAVWSILTDDAQTPLWQHFNMSSRTTWAVGGAIEFSAGDRQMIVGEIVELTPPRRLVHTFGARWSAEVADDKPSRVTWEIEPVGDGVCKLTLTHDDFGGATPTSRAVRGGWPESLSRLKTLAETGTPLLMPAPAQG